MAEKKVTTKKAVKKAPAKKAVAKKAPAKKAVAKKAVAKKAVAKKAPVKKAVAKKAVAKKEAIKKAPAKKAVAKKAPVKKVAKKAPVKTTTVKKATVRKAAVRSSAPSAASSRQVFDSLAPIPELNVATKSVRPEVKRQAPAAISPAPTAVQNEKSGRSKRGIFLLVAVLLFGGIYLVMNRDNQSATTAAPTPVTTPTETATPEPSASATAEPVATESATQEPVAATGTVRASYLYTSTGIRLAWNVSGADAASIEVSTSEDGKAFTSLATLNPEDRALRIIKVDTKGRTTFKVTVTPVVGEGFSTTVGLRGRFTL